MAQPVGIVGLGLMGTAFARRLVETGRRVVGTDIDPARTAALADIGGEALANVRAVTQCSRAVIVAVLNVDQVEDLVTGPDGVLAAAGVGALDGDTVLLLTGTYEPDRIAALAREAARVGVAVLDAPVSGTSVQVLKGEGLGLVGGDPAVVERLRDVLDVMYPRRLATGAVGSATRTKLAINHILGLNRVALAEGLVFAETLGLDPARFLEVARRSAAWSQIMDVKGDKMVRGDFAPQGRLSQHLKDVRIMLAEGSRQGQALPFASLLLEILEAAAAHGEGDDDNTASIKEIRRRKIA